jgi:hypothetical protein
MDNLQNPTPGSDSAANPSPEPTQSTGTVQPSGQADGRQSAPTEESFTNLDPNTLPPQLKAAYNSMLRDYKTKTTEIAEQRKKYSDYDTHKQRSELYEQLASQEEFVKQWNEHVQKQNGQVNQNGQEQDPIQAKIQAIEKQLNEEKSVRQERELADVVDSFSTAKDDKGVLLNPDFDILNNIVVGKNAQGEEYSLLRTSIEFAQGATPQERLANGYKNAKAIRDQIIEEGRKQGMGKMLSKVRNSTEAPTITSDKQVFNGDPKNLSVREARELAEKGMRVH